MGPAYAYAAITLLFNPTRPEDDERLLATVKMLRCMDPTSPQGLSESYHTVADRLLSEWKAAKHQIDPAVSTESDITGADKAVPELFKKLKAFGYSSFAVDDWKSVQDWAVTLLDGTSDKIEVSKKHDLRHALNAAWLARVNIDRTEDISKHAQKLADRVKAKLAKRSSDTPHKSLIGLR